MNRLERATLLVSAACLVTGCSQADAPEGSTSTSEQMSQSGSEAPSTSSNPARTRTFEPSEVPDAGLSMHEKSIRDVGQDTTETESDHTWIADFDVNDAPEKFTLAPRNNSVLLWYPCMGEQALKITVYTQKAGTAGPKSTWTKPGSCDIGDYASAQMFIEPNGQQETTLAIRVESDATFGVSVYQGRGDAQAGGSA